MAESINDKEMGQKIRELVEEMKLYNNPQELEDMKKIMKKNVPLMMRGYLMAYLYVTRNGRTQAKPAHQERKGNQGSARKTLYLWPTSRTIPSSTSATTRQRESLRLSQDRPTRDARSR